MNSSLKEKLSKVGIAVPEMLFPREGTDLSRWSCIACDQFTSEPGYWEDAVSYIGDAPSTLDLMMPEAWIGDESKKAHEDAIPRMMEKYLSDGTLRKLPAGLMYIERQTSAGIRRGVLMLLDLDAYEYEPGNKALCRATEGTVEDRLPVRIDIRKKARFEMPHVMVLLNDKKGLLMDRLQKRAENEKPFYDFELMLGSGRIKGWHIEDDGTLEETADILLKLREEAEDGMLFAVGDGNHSLAAAKRCGDRYALAEFVNLYDDSLIFEPIHRLKKDGQVVDYIHGKEECLALGKRPGYEAVIMPDYPKERLFPDVIDNGVLPKKSFSVGEAKDKRFYLECCMRMPKD